MNLELVFLGTASSVPTEKRNHPGVLVSFGAENILFECGEGTQRQFRIAKLNPCKLTRIILTHWHGDHALGLPGLLETLAMSEYSKELQIYGPRGTKEKISLLEKIYGKFRLSYKVHETSGKIVDEKEFAIEAFPVDHGISTNSYSLIIKDKLRLKKDKIKQLKLPNSPIISKLQEGKNITHPETGKKITAKSVTYLEKGKKLSFIFDTAVHPNAIKSATNADILICESSFISEVDEGERLAKEYKHLTAKQAAQIAKKAKAKKLVLTHISQRYEKKDSLVLKEAKKVFKNVIIAKDFDRIKI